MPEIGDAVQFIDAGGMRHNALLIGVLDNRENNGQGPLPPGKNKLENPPVNLVFVTNQSGKTNPHGNQLERRLQVVHEANADAQDEFWTEVG